MDNDDYIYEDDFDEKDSGSYSQNRGKSSNNSFENGKEIGKNTIEKLKDGSLKEDYEKVKEGIEDLKSGDIKEGIENLKDSADLLHKKNKVEQVGHDIKNTGKTMQKAGDVAEKAGQGIKRAADAGEKLNKAAEQGAKTAKNAGKALETAGKAEDVAGKGVSAAGKGTSAAGDAVNAAGLAADASIVGAPAGLAANAVGTVASVGGKIADAVGTAGQASGQAKQAIGKGQQVAAQGVESGSKLGQAGSKLGKKFGDDLEKAGQKAKDAGKKVEDVGNKIEKTGKDLNNLIKPLTATVDILKKSPKIFLIMVIAGFFISITLLYNNSISHISESVLNFENYKSDIKELVNGLFSAVSEKREQYYKEEFLEEVKNWYNKSNGKIDFPLVFSILFYTDNNNNIQYDYTEISNEDGTPDTSDTDPTYTKGLIKRLNMLCKNMMNGNSVVSEEEYKQYLRDKYISKQPEFKQYYDDADSDAAKENVFNYIIENIYEQRDWYIGVYGDLLKEDAESYQDACYGAIDDDLIKDLALPIDVPDGFEFEFDENTSFGLVNGQIHNGVDLISENSGISYGTDVHSIADGEIENFGQILEKKNTNEANISQPTDATKENDSYIGSWVKIHHNIMVDGKEYEFYSVYKNLSSLANFKKGDKVSKSDIIGKVGKTSSGKELLYFEFRNESNASIDPTNLFIECIEESSIEPGTLLAGNTIDEQIWNFFISNGYSKVATAAALGNLKWESGGLNTAAIEQGNNNEGFGLLQWSNSRKIQFFNYAASQNKDKTDLQVQLSFLLIELKGGDGTNADNQWLTLDGTGEQKRNTWETTSDIEAATSAFCWGFERPRSDVAHLAERLQYAKEYLQMFGNQ